MIVFLGIVGSGKGTQAQILAKRLDCPVITTGDILRQKRNDPRVKAAVDSGTLVTDDVLLPILEEEFKRLDAANNEFVLDGTPRNLPQAQWLVNKIKQGEIKFKAVIHLKLSEDAATRRLKERGRHDDNQETIKERFKIYTKSVMPTLNYLAQEGLSVIQINGDQPVETVAKDIQTALGV